MCIRDSPKKDAIFLPYSLKNLVHLYILTSNGLYDICLLYTSSLTGANNVLLSYVNVKIEELDGRKQELVNQIAELTVEVTSPEQVSQISGYLDTWENVSFDDKRRVVDLMITTVAATSDSLNITWKI